MDIAKLVGLSVFDPLPEETYEHYKNLISPEILERHAKSAYERIADNFYDEDFQLWQNISDDLKDKLRRSVIIAGFIRHIVKDSFVIICSYESFLVDMNQGDIKTLLREIRKYGCRLKEDSETIMKKFSRIKENPWSNQWDGLLRP